MHLERLEFRDVGSVTEKLASSARVTLNEEARDLIAVQTGGDLVLVRNIVHAARSGRASLENFRSVEKLYAEEITRGRTAAYFENAISSSLPDIAAQRRLVELLNFGLDAGGGRFMLEDWQKGLGIANEDFHRMVRALELEECIEVDSASARVTADDAFRDHITARYRLDHTGDTLTAVTAGLIASSLKRTPRIMAEFYRDKTSAGLAGLLAEFDCQEVPTALIDYERFKERFKGLSESEMRSGIAAETDHFQLPQIVHSSAATEFYPQLRDSIEPARTAFGTGFSDRNYSDDNETAWIAAEIDSKLEASRELTEFWCDRLERAAAANDVDNFRIWLVSPEGFSPEAIEALVHRNAIGSSRKQVELLKSFLAGELATVSSAATEYEITIPIGEDMELIAAHSLQEIAERYNFPPRSINQIKTALVEACINAAEHSHSPDRKIYQRFTVHDDRIVIVVSNRGIKLAGRRTSEVDTVSGRRGWGLNLIKGLMDDVKFEQVDDGTRISMTKLLKRES
jgi:serine/threonine-protein kinase RsbW